uniref:Uncharacterized protein n=1 Tax=Anguilla anguilla TaxID=7936 RepID=A0A0E9XBZ1_ANGAN
MYTRIQGIENRIGYFSIILSNVNVVAAVGYVSFCILVL